MKKKILVIDDELDFLKIIKISLESTSNYQIITLANAKDILEQVHLLKPDLILMDILMPGIKGIEACEILNQDACAKMIPVIMLSALDKDADKLRAYKVGAVDFLTKPIERKELIERIEKGLGSKK